MPKAPTVDSIPVGAFACPGGDMDLDAELTAAQAALYLRIAPQTVQSWRKRGHLIPLDNGKYRLRDVLAADKSARDNAGRTQQVA